MRNVPKDQTIVLRDELKEECVAALALLGQRKFIANEKLFEKIF